MQIKFLFILIFLATNLFGQEDLRKISTADLPENIQAIPHISTALSWVDSLGDHVLIITKKIVRTRGSDVTPDQFDFKQDRVLNANKKKGFAGKETIPSFAHHFLMTKDSAILTWKVVGLAKICPEEDINHAKSWFVITDLDKNARAEVWLVYSSSCIDDESKGIIKIVMCENDSRYTVNGEITGGFHESYFDQNFKNGQDIFKKYALQLWNKISK